MIISIDPGVSGAVAILDGSKLVDVFDMPTEIITVNRKQKKRINANDLAAAFNEYPPTRVVIEDVHAMPGQGVTSMFAFGQALGIAHGVAACFTDQVVTVGPRVWKRYFKLDSDKGASRRLASERWPEMAQYFKRMKDDGRAEAALIGLWSAECTSLK